MRRIKTRVSTISSSKPGLSVPDLYCARGKMKVFPEGNAYLECAAHEGFKAFFLLAALWMRQKLGKT